MRKGGMWQHGVTLTKGREKSVKEKHKRRQSLKKKSQYYSERMTDWVWDKAKFLPAGGSKLFIQSRKKNDRKEKRESWWSECGKGRKDCPERNRAERQTRSDELKQEWARLSILCQSERKSARWLCCRWQFLMNSPREKLFRHLCAVYCLYGGQQQNHKSKLA